MWQVYWLNVSVFADASSYQLYLGNASTEDQIFLRFMNFFWKIWYNNRLGLNIGPECRCQPLQESWTRCCLLLTDSIDAQEISQPSRGTSKCL